MASGRLTIGTLAETAQCSVATIRYYEQIGLMPKARRGENGHRYYGEAEVNRLSLIKRAREFGFPLEQVRALVELAEDAAGNCTDLREVARRHLDVLQARLLELEQQHSGLKRFLDDCSEHCADGSTRDCAAVFDVEARRGQSCCQIRPE